MSDIDTIDDILWEAATNGKPKEEKASGTLGKRKKRGSGEGGKVTKKRKTDAGASEGSEAESDDEDANNLYPLEGKYKNEADRQRLNDMPEMQREEILAHRQEEMQKRLDEQNLTKLLAAQEDSVANAAKRKHQARGTTKEKSHTLDQLKARRKAKEERLAQHIAEKKDSPTKRASPASSDMEFDSEEEGQLSLRGRDDYESDRASPPRERERTRDKRKEDRSKMESISKAAVLDRKTAKDDLTRIQLTRTQLMKECMKPWFEDYVKHAWVRYLIGQHEGKPMYRACLIKNLGAQLVAPYKLEDEMVNHQLELAIGDSVKAVNMDRVSNAEITPGEWRWMESNLKQKRLPLPTLAQILKKREQIKELENRRLTEADVSAMIKRRQSVIPKMLSTYERLATKSRLMTEHRMAIGRRDFEDAKRIQMELDEFAAMWDNGGDSASHSANNSGTEGPGGNKGEHNRLEAISARNRAQNLENARRIEAAEAEKRRLARVEALKRMREKERAEKEAAETIDESLDPELEGADIGTRMAHLVEIEIDF